MLTCKICSKTVKQEKHWVNCPRFGQAVCMRHCNKEECKYKKEEHCSFIRRERNN